ncbi:MAG TPA: glycosyl hydrolase family 8 [Acidimicrobiales bacterium]
MRRALAAAVALVVVLAVGAAVILARRGADDPVAAPLPEAPGQAPAAEAFLSGYVDGDGRVVRRDQGGDTVSEGQAYALMLAASIGDEARFDRVWAWTQDQLQRDDGLFAWRWQDGQVVDENPAPDADADIASALTTAAERFDDPRLEDEARRVAKAVLDHETAEVDGRPVLVAGPWAVDDRVVNPSYGARCDYDALARLTGDERWRQLGEGSAAVLSTLVDDGLPPDWAVLDADGTPRPVAGPDGRDGPARYGLDAARIPARLSACTDGRELAARLWDRIRPLDEHGAALAYSLDGEPLAGDRHPVGLIGAAGAAQAAGHEDEAERLFAAAADLEREHPTYYGAAWLGLGEVLLGLHAEHLAGAGRLEVVVVGVAAQTDPGTTAPAEPAQTDPTTTALPAQTDPTTTAPTATTAPPDTTGTTSPPGTTDTTGGSSPTTTGGGTTGTTTPGGGSSTPTTTSPDGPSSTTTTPEEAGDLSSTGEPGEQLSSDPSAERSSPGEPARRRTGAIALAGLAGIVALAAVLGLRERAVLVRSRPTSP